MRISIIAAIDNRGLIGDEAGLPWHLPKDLRRFRACTWGKPILMGRKTFELIGKPLPGRFNIVLTRNPEASVPGCQVARTLQEGLALAREYLAGAGGDEVMIIGGARVYAEVIHSWDRLYLTLVEGQFKGTEYFPVRELLRESWRPTCAPEICPPDEKNPHRHSFHILERIRERTLPQACAAPETALEGLDLAAILARGNMVSSSISFSNLLDGASFLNPESGQ